MNAPLRVYGPYEAPPGSRRLKHARIYVPRDEAHGPRPLLLMFDGQNVFDDAPSYAGGWHAHTTVERLARTVARPVIVGLEHGGVHRMTELNPFSRHGELEAFLVWIRSELLPPLRRELHLTADPAHTVIAGSSMGGLAALWAVLGHPEAFGGAIAMSPSLWVGNGAMLRWVEGHGVPRHRRIYLDAGAHEGRGRMLANARRLGGLLHASGHVDLRFRADPRGRHREADWRRRLLPALRFHFGTHDAPRVRRGKAR